MITKVNGGVATGLWFSADAIFAELSVTGATFSTDASDPQPGDSLELVYEALAARGTVLGFSVESETVLHILFDYGQAYGTSGTTVGNQSATDVLTEVEAAIDANAGLSASAFTNVGVTFRAGATD